jgi:2-polyprenyl-3-methyl-5-hydroxy-6-metoxy-1,4-benzoquinol methylase
MYESIIETYKLANYDFRKTANSNDPLIHLFPEWIDYYKLKWSIARVLKPSSILEIGVRFGYSAAAFLDAYPSAKYVGIDLNTDSFGGVKGGINWAKQITQGFNAELIVADTQIMNSFPGGIYDLIHVDGQQDGDGSFHDLELAVKQARYVLVDGYFWTRQNFLAVSDFVFRNAYLLDWYSVIPGYAGELIIKVSDDYLIQNNQDAARKTKTSNSSLAIRQAYTNEYFTQDCGGFDVYKKNKGKKLQDSRLIAVATISNSKKSGRVLDLGCGRGELSYYYANQGFLVTSIDYSQSAIELAKKCFDDEENLKSNVEFICDDVCNAPLTGKYDLAVASDLIEHLSFVEVDKLYKRVSEYLNPDGLFVLHTFPNLWYYKYHYSRQRKIAASVGAYLPPEPRSRYEMLMHINEQSPRILKKQLGQYFEYVHLWFACPENPGGSLVKKFSIKEIMGAPSLFAIASHQQIDKEELKEKLQMQPISAIPAGKIKLLVTDYPRSICTNNEFEIQLQSENYTKFNLNSFGPNPVHIAYHWMNENASDYIVFDGERTKMFPSLNKTMAAFPKILFNQVQKGTYSVKVKSLGQEGKYILRVTLVQESVRWFDSSPTQLYQDISISITN